MELLQLRYFLVAAKYQHMTKAAEVLQIAQPALSQSIKRLEQELGVSLFEREKRNIRLNDAGRFLEQKLLPIMAALDEIPSEIQKKERMNQRTIHLNLLAATRLVTDCIIAYKELHPEILIGNMMISVSPRPFPELPSDTANSCFCRNGFLWLFRQAPPTQGWTALIWPV